MTVESAAGGPARDRRNKLGLALAGGGFRASLFHLGVLRRMAELDLLRYVEVLSTVSGGSIIGALYALLLKKYLEHPARGGRLSRDDYLDLMDELQSSFTGGVRKNLRTRLFMNPLGILRVLSTTHTLGKRMARLYERYVYARIVGELQPQGWWDRWFRPGQIALKDIRIRPAGEEIRVGIEAYNRKIVAEAPQRPDPGSVLTRLILNATSLNSGGRFWFSSTEIGDWFLGFVRRDEIDVLLDRKRLLEGPTVAMLEAAVQRGDARITLEGHAYDRRTAAFALWWRTARPGTGGPSGWEALFRVAGFPGRLPGGEFGRLRFAKLAAWYLRHPDVQSGLSADEHARRFWSALEEIDEELTKRLRTAAEGDPAVRDLLLAFALELYYVRAAEVVSPRVARDWDALTLGEAVGASACFPPVFPPMQIYGFYDDWHVSRLGLTDGGVYDNIGLTALLDEGCDTIIASDTSGLFGVQERASAGRLGMMARISSILMAGVAWKQRDLLQERRRVSRQISRHLEAWKPPDPEWRAFHSTRELYGLAFFHISSPRVQPPPPAGPDWDRQLDPAALANIRTDLDGFGEVEVAALVNHGYATADRFIRRYIQDPPYRGAHWNVPPQMPIRMVYDDRVRRIVDVGAARFGRSLKLGAWVSWGFSVALAAGVAALWVGDGGRRFAGDVWGWVRALGADLVTAVVRFPVAAVVFVLLVALAPRWTTFFRFNLVRWLHGNQQSRWARLAGGIAKWGRGFSGNLLWPLGGAPIWIALGFALLAAVSHVFYYLPFRRITRRDPGP